MSLRMSGLRAVFVACILGISDALLTQRRFQWETSLPEVPAAQRVTPAIFSYGRPTRQEVYRFKQAGFKSIVSVGPVARKTVPQWFELHGEYMSDEEYHTLAKSIDMPLHVFVWGWDGLMKREAFDEFAAVMDSFPKPVLVHCGNGWLAALMGGLYAVRSGAYPPEEYYSRSADIGFEYQNETGLNLLYANLTHTRPRPSVPKKLHKRLNDMGYSKYYYTRRVNDDLYVMGQPNVTLEFDAMAKAGYGAFVSLRVDGEKKYGWVEVQCCRAQTGSRREESPVLPRSADLPDHGEQAADCAQHFERSRGGNQGYRSCAGAVQDCVQVRSCRRIIPGSKGEEIMAMGHAAC
mmetsp:Transcript_58957/g.133329  ORF Transcript_58957/g.133329 Transcript_58957/m.133329 type:complete len:349 (-) Transcript_58957:230-1276(-)